MWRFGHTSCAEATWTCAYRGRASRTKCARSIDGKCWVSERPTRWREAPRLNHGRRFYPRADCACDRLGIPRIAPKISFLTFSIVRSSRCWIPTVSVTFTACWGSPVRPKPSPLVMARQRDLVVSPRTHNRLVEVTHEYRNLGGLGSRSGFICYILMDSSATSSSKQFRNTFWLVCATGEKSGYAKCK